MTAIPDGRGIKYTREDANVHISETAFSVPTSYKVTVVDSEVTNGNPSSVTGAKIDLAKYPFLRKAISAVETRDGSTVFADNSIWWVRLDDPDTTGTDEDETSDLQIALSTKLMKEADWYNANGGYPVQFQFSAVHVLRAGAPVETHVVGANFFAFEQREAGQTVEDAGWSDVTTDIASEINMEAGQYQPMQFAFTQPGVYRVQVNVQGHVRDESNALAGAPDTWSPISPDETITGPVEWYTFHVGPEADLGVTLEHTDETSDADTTVTDGTASFSVKATNDGPETAEDVVVEVSLPVGLDYVTDTSHTGVTFECGVVSWKVGNLDSGASDTLDFTADVGTGAAKSLTAEAEVHSSTVDDNELNDTASVEVDTNSTVVTPPFFPGVTRSIVEHGIEGTHAGDPVAAINPDVVRLYYELSGRCYGWFEAHSTGQITLKSGRTLEYDEQSEFHLTLHVSDEEITRTDGEINLETVDDSIPVTIKVTDTDETVHPTVTFYLTPVDSDVAVTGNPVSGTMYWLRTTVNNAPEGANLTYDWFEEGGHYHPTWTGRTHTSYYPTQTLLPGTKKYKVHVKWPGGGITARHTIDWVAP